MRKGVCEPKYLLCAHYKDIHGLAEELEAELLRDLDGMVRKLPIVLPGAPRADVTRLAGELYGFFEKHRDFCAVLLGPYGDQHFIQVAVEKGRVRVVREFMRRYASLSKQRAEILFSFLAWGVLGILNYSVANNLSAKATADALAMVVAGEVDYLAKR